MAGKFSMPRFEREDLESTQELPKLPEDFEPLPEPISQPESPEAIRPQDRYEPQEEFDLSEEYDPEEELPEDFIDTALRILRQSGPFFAKHWKKALLIGCALALAIVVGIIGSITVTNADPYDDKILNNVMVANVLVGGMTKDQAITTLNANLANAYATQAMTIDLGEQVIKLDPAQVDAKLDVAAAIDAAFSHGRTGTDAEREQAYQNSLSGNYILAVLPYLSLNEDHIRSTLEAVEEASVSALTQPSYRLEGDVDNFTTDNFDPNSSGQTLVLTLGTPQVDFDAGKLYEQVIDAYSLGQFLVEAPGPAVTQEPESLDLDAIYQEFLLEPKAPTLDMTDFNTIPGTYGREFDLGEAKLQVARASYGAEIRIPMTYPAPEGDPSSVLFRDVLGEWSTAYPDDEDWKQNLKKACKAIDGVELNPGDVFSFNAIVGQRKESRGYVEAAACGHDEEETVMGGGVCQAASTVYIASLLSDLEITSRTAHAAPPSYTEKGLDADVNWDGADLSFRNTSIYPIRISAQASGGYVKVQIIGTDMRSYTTEIESSISETVQPRIIYQEYDYDNDEGYEDGDVIQKGTNGYQVKIYKRKYDKESRDLTSREFVVTSSYPSQDKIIAQVVPPVIETEPTDPPSETIPITLPTDPETGEVGDIEAVG